MRIFESLNDAAEPVVTILNPANQQSTTAVVSDRYYFATDIPLEVGANDLTVTATDQRGNARSQSVRVVRIAVGSKRIQASVASLLGQFLSRSFVVLLRKSIPQNYNLKTAA